MAAATAFILSLDSVVILLVSLDFAMVVMSSRFMMHLAGSPSSGPRGTSAGILRIVLVIGAIVTEVLES